MISNHFTIYIYALEQIFSTSAVAAFLCWCVRVYVSFARRVVRALECKPTNIMHTQKEYLICPLLRQFDGTLFVNKLHTHTHTLIRFRLAAHLRDDGFALDSFGCFFCVCAYICMRRVSANFVMGF